MVYYLTMLFVLIGFFQVVRLTIVTEPLARMMNQIFPYDLPTRSLFRVCHYAQNTNTS